MIMEDNMIGMKLDGRYEITERIGVGGMSDVYKGRDIMEGRTVAVKILKPEFCSNEEFVRCFRNESKAIAVLSHPNIVKIFDVGHENALEYIVMEYIDGITLKEYIEQIGLVPWRECVHYTIQILRALQLAHDRGIVHRDIKPQNVMRLSDGTIKVMDFGIARFSRQNPGMPTEKTMGSVHYVSPEQARGEHTDERSDIYSVGVMMYEMLTGRKPFDGDTPVSVALKHMNEEPVKPSQFVSSMYTGLEEIILRAMEKDPAKRYQSASGMIMDIEAFKNDQSVVFGYADEPVKKPERSSKLLMAAKNKKAQPDKPKKVKAKKPEPPVQDYVVYEDSADDDEDDEPRHNYILPILAAMTVTVIIVATLFLSKVILGAFKTTASSSNDYTMPKLVGLNYYDARAEYPDIQLAATEEYNSENPAGIIIEQEKAEGRIVKIGDVIKVVVSKGTRMVTVPDVVNFHYNSANAALIGENLKCLRIEVESDDIAAGYVVKTDPVAYSTIEEGSTVKVYVSIGPSTEDTVVPYVVGYSVTEAEAMLNDAFLVTKIQYTESSEPADTVISQNIAEGDIVTRNTTVTIYVSDGTGMYSDPFADPWGDINLSDDPTWQDDPNGNGNQTNSGVPDNTVTDPDDGRKYVTVKVDIPSNVTSSYSLTFYDTQTSEAVSDKVVFSGSLYGGSYIEVKVYGESGTITASASLKSPRTGLKSELAQYTINFDDGTYYCSQYSQYVFTIVDMNTMLY